MGKCYHGEGEREEGALSMSSECPSTTSPVTEEADDVVDGTSQKLSPLDITEGDEETSRTEGDEGPSRSEDDDDPSRTEGEEGPSGTEGDEGMKGHTNNVHIKKRNSVARTPSGWALRSRQNSDRLRVLRSVVEKAIADHKIFSVAGSPSIRAALKQRGWLEKKTTVTQPRPRKKTVGAKKSLLSSTTSSDCDSTDSFSNTLMSSMSKHSTDDYDTMLISRLLRQTPVDFIWTTRVSIEWGELSKFQMVNRFPRAYFTSKVGLCSYMQQMHWYCEMGVSNILFPRCYNIGPGNEISTFKYDFHLTACLSFLKWLVAKYEEGGEVAVKSPEGRVPHSVITFSLDRCNEYISKQAHEDIDQKDHVAVWDHQWDHFLTCYYMTLHGNNLIHETADTNIAKLYIEAKETLSNIHKYWPQLELDGILNIWIVKPGNQSRGRGIQMMTKLEEILARVNPSMSKESRYVVQKYIERPLLIHKTKFDIRQWFLVTSAEPLTIWLYKESYLRFCSQTFSLHNMHESVHLCNNAVQCRYKNGKRESPDLPDENMWDCYTFQAYLRTIGKADVWENRIYPGMREGIIGALLASQEHMDRRSNCFELFGADFMLTEDFSPWLIEINSHPCMSPSTSVTARMCPQCLEDVIKVVVDRRYNKRASTGMFELVYKQQIPPAPPYLGMSLAIQGKKILKDNTKTRKKLREKSDDRSSTSSHLETKEKIKKYGAPIIVDLISSLAHNLEDALSEFENTSEEDEVKAKPLQNRNTSETLKKKVMKGQRKTKNTNKKCREKDTVQARGKVKSPASISSDKDDQTTGGSIEPVQSPEDVASTFDTVHDGTATPPDKIWVNPTMEGETTTTTEQEVIPTSASVSDSSADTDLKPSRSGTDKQQPGQATVRYSYVSIDQKLSKEGTMQKPSYNNVNQGIGWETSNKPTIRDIVNKLAQTQYEREFFMYTKGQGLINSLSGTRLFASKEKNTFKQELKRLQSPLNVTTANELLATKSEKDGKSVGQKIRTNPQVYHSYTDRNTQSRLGLPTIRQRSKPCILNDSQNNCNLDNFYAIGMSLKSMQKDLKGMRSSFNQAENLLLPLGSVSSLDLNTATTKPSVDRFQ